MTDAEKVELLAEAARDAIDLLPRGDATHDARTRLVDALKEVDA